MYRKMLKPRNRAEAACFDKITKHGWDCTKKGFPDFWCIKDEKVVFVEVKLRSSEALKVDQILFMNIMSKHGIPCFKFSLDKGFEKWEDIAESEMQKRQKVQESKDYEGRTLVKEFRKWQ